MKTKNGRKRPIRFFPSFVYRQDGFELSDSIFYSIPRNGPVVKELEGPILNNS